jgi:class 3 adenylate cyclase
MVGRAVMGAPMADEEHALRACSAALAMETARRDYANAVRRTPSMALCLREDRNAGEVVRAMSNELPMDDSAVGQTGPRAARLEQLAAPGRVFLTAAAWRLVEGLGQVNARGPRLVKGLSEPVEGDELVGASGLGRCLQAAVARGLTRFVGRDCYRASIWCGMGAVWRRTGAGRGC